MFGKREAGRGKKAVSEKSGDGEAVALLFSYSDGFAESYPRFQALFFPSFLFRGLEELGILVSSISVPSLRSSGGPTIGSGRAVSVVSSHLL